MRGSNWEWDIRSILLSMSLLQLDTIDTVDAVNEQDENEDERNLDNVSALLSQCFWAGVLRTFMPYCSFAMSGLSEMKENSFLRQVNGMGMMRDMKRSISNMRSTKTCRVIALVHKQSNEAGQTYEAVVERHGDGVWLSRSSRSCRVSALFELECKQSCLQSGVLRKGQISAGRRCWKKADQVKSTSLRLCGVRCAVCAASGGEASKCTKIRSAKRIAT